MISQVHYKHEFNIHFNSDYSNYGIERFRCEVPLDSIPFTDSSIKISAGNKLN